MHAAIKRSRQGDFTFWLSALVSLASTLESSIFFLMNVKSGEPDFCHTGVRYSEVAFLIHSPPLRKPCFNLVRSRLPSPNMLDLLCPITFRGLGPETQVRIQRRRLRLPKRHRHRSQRAHDTLKDQRTSRSASTPTSSVIGEVRTFGPDRLLVHSLEIEEKARHDHRGEAVGP